MSNQEAIKQYDTVVRQGDPYQCKDHVGNNFEFVCTHPMCRGFKFLCKICEQEHRNFHESVPMKNEPQFSQTIHSLRDFKNQIRKIVLQAKEDLDLLQDKALQQLKISHEEETSLDQIINDLREIKQQVMKIFDSYIDNLRLSFERPIQEKIHRIYEEIDSKLEHLKSLMKELDDPEMIRQIFQAGIEEQVQYQNKKLEEMINYRKQLKFTGKIDDDVAMRFNGNFLRELDNLILYKIEDPNHQIFYRSQYTIRENQESLTEKEKLRLPQASDYVYRIDFTEQKIYQTNLRSMQDQKFKIDFLGPGTQIYQNYQTVLGQDEDLYIFLGYDSQNIQCVEDENKFKKIFRLEFKDGGMVHKQVPADEKQLQFRSRFSAVKVNNFIYLIAGFHYAEGCLQTCQKICVQKGIKNFGKVNQIAMCKIATCESTATSFQNKYIIKVAGITYPGQLIAKPVELTNSFEIYSIEHDIWQKIEMSHNTMIKPFYCGSCVQIDQKSLYVFGGKTTENHFLQQAFIMTFSDIEENVGKENIKMEIDVNLSVPKLPYGAYFQEQPVIFNNNVYATFYQEKDSSRNHQVHHEIKTFNLKKGWKNPGIKF